MGFNSAFKGLTFHLYTYVKVTWLFCITMYVIRYAEFIYINISVHQEAFYITEHTIKWLFLICMKEQIINALVCTTIYIKPTNFHFINTNSFYCVTNKQN